MNAFELLAKLERLGVKLSIQGERLQVRAPRGTLGADLREALGHCKPEIIALLRSNVSAGRSGPPLQRRLRRDPAPLSFAQQRLWFVNQMTPDTAVYNIPVALRLEGKLDPAALEQALTALVARQESLRTTFDADGDSPVQVIRPPGCVEVPLDDLAGLPQSRREWQAERLAAEEARRPFDLSGGPLFRARLVRLQAEDHLLLLTMHHIVSDAWSVGVLLRELGALYEAFLDGRPSPLPALAVQYADFAAWQREWLTGEALEEPLAYWKRKLADPPTLQLPADHPRPAVATFRGSRARLAVPASLPGAIQPLCRQEGVTPFMAFLAAFDVLIGRYCDRLDVLVGCPVANRNRPEVEDVIGFFVNMLVMRTDLSGDPSFRELLGRVRETALGAYAHQDVPFEKLVEALELPRDLSRNPLFQVAFALQNVPMPRLALADLSVRLVETSSGAARFDLSLFLGQSDQGLQGRLEYNADLFEPSTIERMCSHYRVLLEGIVADPDRRISQLPLLSKPERRQLLVQWNQTARAYPKDVPVHALFERQAQQTPDAVAVQSGGDRLSYGELNARANQLARYLQKQGIGGPQAMVGIFLERSMDMIVAVLGVLKAGGAYVPLDLDYPKPRLEFMLRDTAAPVTLTRSHLLPRMPGHAGRVVCLDTDWEAIAAESGSHLQSNVGGDALAYVIYTSGSTGVPKGTCIPHRAINRLVCNPDYVTLTPEDRVAQVSNCSFDAATFEIWGPLVKGARVVIFPREVSLSPREFAAELRSARITTLFLTTALFNQIAREVPDAFASLRHVLFGGEAVDPIRVRSVLESGPPERLLHMYGPTETTTFATWYLVEHVPRDAQTVPIGRPIANTQLYVLDARMNPAPVGVPGELYIGGDGLAREYWNQPELTNARFVPDPFRDAAGGRLYRTGDVVRYLADGNVEFLGRRDGQVKIRGFRVELGEIESALRRHPRVREAVALAREDVPGDKRLVAYVVVSGSVSPVELRRFLAKDLPGAMVPAAFVFLEALPLNPNGKVDRRALPIPGRQAEQSYVAPRGEVERQVADIWSEVLGLDRVGVHDNFFDVGGHSLLLMQLRSRLQKAFDRSVPIVELFKYPTVSGLAHYFSEQQAPPRPARPADGADQSAAAGRRRLQKLYERRKQADG